MAINQFYVDGSGSGSDINSGSTTGAVVYTTTSGNWDGTSVFTPTDGSTPASSIAAGDWVSVFNNGATLLVYIVQVVSVAAGVNGAITCSTTAKYGTAPTSNATQRSLRAGGCWNTPFAFINTGTTAVYNSTQINVRNSTYASTTTNRTFNNTGSATALLIWEGYNTTPGDCNTNYTLTHPSLTWTTSSCTINGQKQIFRNINFSGARTTGTQCSANGEIVFKRCRFTNTGANAASSALSIITTSGPKFADCYFSATSTATRVVQSTVSAGFRKCTFDGGGIGFDTSSSLIPSMIHCVFINNTSHGINQSGTGTISILYSTFIACGGSGINYASVPTGTTSCIYSCIFISCGVYGINNAGGTNTQIIDIQDCSYYGNSSGQLNGVTDNYQINAITEASSPVVSGSNPTLIGTALGANVNLPFENESAFTGGYYDVGALQRTTSSVSGSYVPQVFH